MNIKVFILAIFSFLVSGCVATSSPAPDNKPKDNNVTVVESIEATPAVEQAKTIVTPIEESKVVTKDNKYGLKPEPFSLDSQEQDPELLGPQSTLDRTLDKSDAMGKKAKKKDSTKKENKPKKA